MSNKKNNLTDQEIEHLFKEHADINSETEMKANQHSEITKKIIRKAKTETSAKTITEYSLVNFWTVLLEFINVFCSLLSPKNVTDNNQTKNQEPK